MSTLADEGLVLFAWASWPGPNTDASPPLYSSRASSEAEIHCRLADDPLARSEMLVTTSVEPWTLLVGARLVSVA